MAEPRLQLLTRAGCSLCAAAAAALEEVAGEAGLVPATVDVPRQRRDLGLR